MFTLNDWQMILTGVSGITYSNVFDEKTLAQAAVMLKRKMELIEKIKAEIEKEKEEAKNG